MILINPYGYGSGAGYVAGRTISNLANTSVSAGSAGGYRIQKSGGTAGSWDAAAVASAVSGSSRVRIKFGSGDYRGGLSPNPSASIGPATGVNGAYLVWVTGGLVYLIDRFGNQLGPNQGSASGYAWVDYSAADDKVRFYKGTSGDFGSATLLRTEGPIGIGSSWGFDSILYSSAATFEALVDPA